MYTYFILSAYNDHNDDLVRWIPTRFIIINTLFVLCSNCVFCTPTVPPYWCRDPIVQAAVREELSQRLTDTDAACRRPKLFHVRERSVWCLTCLSREIERDRGRERDKEVERERGEKREISLSGIWEPACCEWRSSTRRHQPAQTKPNGSPNSVRQFVNSFQSRAHIAIKTRRLCYFPPPSSCLPLPCLVLSCLALSQRRAST